MNDGLRPYPEYKDSELHWLGQIPRHWNEKRAKNYLREFDERSTTGEEPLMSVSHKTGVTLRKSNVTMFRAASNVGHKICRPGDLAINTLWAWMAALGVSSQTGLVSPAYGVYRQRDATNYHPEFLDFLLRTPAYATEYRCRSTGITTSRLRLYPIDFLRIPLIQPPNQEQEQIVNYLRYQDGLVRKFIRNRRRLIEMLNEQKQAIINHAVTRGLDPSVRLKPSGLAFVGEIPQGWEVVTLRYLSSKFGSGVTPRGGAAVYQQNGVPLLRSQNIHFDGLRLEGVARIAPELHAQLSVTHVRPNDVLLNITGASIGRVCAVPADFTEANVNQHVCIIRPRMSRVQPEYLAAYMSTGFMQREIYIEQNGASREGLALDAIRAFKVILPPLSVQRDILEYVSEATATLVGACQKAECEIELIRQYHTRLIADVVTGKLDVRHLAPAPEEIEPEDLESIDGEEDFDDELTDGVDAELEEVAHADD